MVLMLLTLLSPLPVVGSHALVTIYHGTIYLIWQARIIPTLVTFNALAALHASVGDVDATENTLHRAASAG